MPDSPCTIFPPVLHLLASAAELGPIDLPWQAFPTDWTGQPLPGSAAFRLATDGRWIRFEARSAEPPSAAAPGETAGAFVEALWKRDVAEVFLAEEGTTHYTEWNLSPHGAWWSQGFLAERVPDQQFQPESSVITWTEPFQADGWSAGLLFPWPSALKIGALRINATMILGSNPRRYLATVRLPQASPDFHIIKWFPKPVLKKN